MKKIITLLGLLLITFCLTQCKKEKEDSDKTKETKTQEKQLNITLLLDLSDRISPSLYPNSPEHFQRDSAIVRNVAGVFKSYMKKQGAFKAKSKIRVITNPVPKDKNINDIMEKMDIDLSSVEKNASKKEIFNSIETNFSENISKIYDLAIQQNKYPGSDIWRFFKNDTDKVIVDDINYRNILIIVTDGYIYHEDSKIHDKNRTSYLLPSILKANGFRNNNDWKEKFDRSDYGFIATRNDLENLEILVLEITPSPKNDESIIKAYLSKWFEEMGIKKYEIYNTDLQKETKKRIERFIEI